MYVCAHVYVKLEQVDMQLVLSSYEKFNIQATLTSPVVLKGNSKRSGKPLKIMYCKTTVNSKETISSHEYGVTIGSIIPTIGCDHVA